MCWVRCSWCKARRTLNRKPDAYTVVPKCRTPGCWTRSRKSGRGQRWYVDKWRAKHERGPKAPRACRCGEPMALNGKTFPHRLGSGFCKHNHSLTEEQIRERLEPAEY